MNQKIQVAVLCGGQSAEHEVSIESAKNVIRSFDPSRYQVSVIYISYQGVWLLLNTPDIVLNNHPMSALPEDMLAYPVTIHPGSDTPLLYDNGVALQTIPVDIVFSVLHGTQGEDGAVQGMLELLNIPYVGSGVAGSAVAMNKVLAKQLLRDSGIAVADWIAIAADQQETIDFATVEKKLGVPFFVKPANTGSSVGVSKVDTALGLKTALSLAAKYDHTIIIERFISGREVECAVLGNDRPEASVLAEIVPAPQYGFYSYEAKYVDPNGATLVVPAVLPETVCADIQRIAKAACAVLTCAGMARVDFFVTPDNQIYLNEVNTLPGFTQISMYPRLWSATGVGNSELVERLVSLGFERFKQCRVLGKQTHVAAQKGN